MTTRADHLASRIQALIAQRQLAPGSRLPAERKLAQELTVSRSSLREHCRSWSAKASCSAAPAVDTFCVMRPRRGLNSVLCSR